MCLFVQENELSQLPLDMGTWTSITELNLSTNQLKVLPDDIEKLVNLEVRYPENREFDPLNYSYLTTGAHPLEQPAEEASRGDRQADEAERAGSGGGERFSLGSKDAETWL